MPGDHCPHWLLGSQGPCTMPIFLRFRYSLPSPCLEWNSNLRETHRRNQILYDIAPMGDFYAAADFVSVFILQQSSLVPATPGRIKQTVDTRTWGRIE